MKYTIINDRQRLAVRNNAKSIDNQLIDIDS